MSDQKIPDMRFPITVAKSDMILMNPRHPWFIGASPADPAGPPLLSETRTTPIAWHDEDGKESKIDITTDAPPAIVDDVHAAHVYWAGLDSVSRMVARALYREPDGGDPALLARSIRRAIDEATKAIEDGVTVDELLRRAGLDR